ncbi:FtsX-like permease family protein [uncultured Amnibacterium sp.]|uniref:FtsX-like permease family protein n=1 Tax=uncultured Amnibacterium sp. TaxID=1631851 RepID=UPI0035C9CEF9
MASRRDRAARPRLGLLLRLAWRIARHASLRSALIVLLIAVPTFGLAGVATVATSMIPTANESATAELGGTQAHLTVVSPPDTTLVQSPNNSSNFRWATDEKGPTHHDESAPLVSPYSYLPAGRLLTLHGTTVTARTAGGVGSFGVTQGDAFDPAFAGKYVRDAGRAPGAASEVMVTPALAERLGATIGSTVHVIQPRAVRLTVVGVLRDLTKPAADEQLFTLPRVIDRSDPRRDPTGTDYYLTGSPVSWPQVQALNKHGAVVLSRAVVENPPAVSELGADSPSLPSQLLIALPLAGFALLEVVLLAGAAFMVGAKRDERTLAMLGAIGANRSALFAVVITTGIVLGALGGVIGTVTGAAAAAVYIRITSDGSITQYPGFHPWPLLLIGIALFGTIAGLAAAVLPARAASRTDVLAALRGSSRPPIARRRRPIAGLIALILGAALTFIGAGLIVAGNSAATNDPHAGLSPVQLAGAALAFLGPALMQLGVLLLSRFLLTRIAGLAARFGVGARLGTEDTARNPSRSVPAVAVIMTTLFLGSLLMTIITSMQAQQKMVWNYSTPPQVLQIGLDELYRSPQAHKAQKAEQLNQAVTSSFDVASVHKINSTPIWDGVQTGRTLIASPMLQDRPRCLVFPRDDQASTAGTECPQASPYYLNQRVYLGTAADLAVMLGAPVNEDARATLQAGGAVALYPQYVKNGHLTIQWHTAKQFATAFATGRPITGSKKQLQLPAVVQRPPHDYDYGVFMLTTTARRHGLATQQALTLAPLRSPVTDRQYDQADAAAIAIAGGADQMSPVFARVEQGPPTDGSTTAWAVLALCALIALAAAAIAIGLSRAEGRRDQWILTALGSSPALRRTYAFWQTLSITITGAVLGVLLGLIPVAAIALQHGQTAIPFVAPWPQLAAAAIGLPLLIAAATSTTSRPPRQLKAPIA